MRYNNSIDCNPLLPKSQSYQRLSDSISVFIKPGFDLIRINSPGGPVQSALHRMKLTVLSKNEAYAIALKKSLGYTYTHIAKQGILTVRWKPIIINRNICFWKVPASELNINASNLCPYQIKQIAEHIYGSIDDLKLAYLEARIDIYGTSLQEILRRLMVLNKRYRYNYKGTSYTGKAPKHQIVVYDRKGKMPDKAVAPIRIESRIRLKSNERPYLGDWLEGKKILEEPFKKAFLVDVDALGLTRDEKIALAKCKHGLTGFMMSLSKKNKRNRKTVLQRHARKNIILDLNALFNTWESAWHKCVIPQCQVLSNKPDLNSSYSCPGEEAV